MNRLFLAILLFTASALADDHPIPDFYGEYHASEYPDDSYPVTTSQVGPIIAASLYTSLDNGGSCWVPTTGYPRAYILQGPDTFHGTCPTSPTLAFIPNLFGTFQIDFAASVDTLRIRLVMHDQMHGIKVGPTSNGPWTTYSGSLFAEESGAVSNDCGWHYNANPFLPTIDCSVHQAIVAAPANNGTLYLTHVDDDEPANILKVSAVADVVEPPELPPMTRRQQRKYDRKNPKCLARGKVLRYINEDGTDYLPLRQWKCVR